MIDLPRRQGDVKGVNSNCGRLYFFDVAHGYIDKGFPVLLILDRAGRYYQRPLNSAVNLKGFRWTSQMESRITLRVGGSGGGRRCWCRRGRWFGGSLCHHFKRGFYFAVVRVDHKQTCDTWGGVECYLDVNPQLGVG